ncbi:MAG: Uma2 family endonuclease [Gammaproteobacteria bacterium]|nr:Uma2 family endonuclease [Gammaproteobacteria bacterium]
MSTITELERALRSLSAAELESIADWLECEVEESRYRAFHVREAQPKYSSEEEPLFMTWEEYLAFEEQSPYRHEYVNGTVYAMSGASLTHNRIAQELVVAFRTHLRGGPCEPFFLEAKLEIRAGRDQIMYYPDAMVSCRPEDRTDQTVRNPKLVVEILSKSTQHIDRREKAMTYQRVEAIEEYVLIAQHQPRVIVHRRAEGWQPVRYASMDARVELRSIGLHMTLAQIYAGSLPASSDP